MRRGSIFSRYFSALAEGDPVAIGVTIVFALFVALVAFVAWRSKVQMKREDESRKNRWKKKA